MDLPDGYYSPDDKRVCKLKKSLYGLKQAPRQWNAKLTQTLIESGFKQSKSDYSLFTKSEDGNFLAFLVYVDNIIVTRNNFDEIQKFKDFLITKFQIKDLGKLKYFLRIDVLETDQGLCLSQRKYCLDLLSEFGLLACKPSATPLEHNLAITNEPTDVDKVLDNITEYQKLIGKLIYLTKASLEAFVDVDWAKCLVTRKSVTGFCAEYKAMASVTSEVTWILKVLRDLEWDQVLPVNLFCDSQAAIKIATNPVFHESTAVQPADIFTKELDKSQHENLILKLGMIDVFQLNLKFGGLRKELDSWRAEAGQMDCSCYKTRLSPSFIKF
ncbi:ribonuclease H-like domain-containing protein [Tanacetum coccineum]|uniref:Ribonuclease H-like domain-containing protein n=1 Tax=Tanacetum coccineum TaxID=301880 RepID=A0ABQ5J8I7_9ASTR